MWYDNSPLLFLLALSVSALVLAAVVTLILDFMEDDE